MFFVPDSDYFGLTIGFPIVLPTVRVLLLVCRWLLVEEEVELRRKQAEEDRLARQEAMKRDMMRANEEQRRIRERLAAGE